MAKPKAPPGRYIPVDVWTLRCLYNRSDYSAQIISETFIVLHREQSKWRNGSRTVQVYYGLKDTSGRGLMVTLQWFENEQAEVLRSGFKDPKQFYSQQHSADYHQHGGNRWWERMRRSPESLLGEWDTTTRLGRSIISIQRAYGSWRTWKCRWFGPVEAYRQRFLFWARGLFGE